MLGVACAVGGRVSSRHRTSWRWSIFAMQACPLLPVPSLNVRFFNQVRDYWVHVRMCGCWAHVHACVCACSLVGCICERACACAVVGCMCMRVCIRRRGCMHVGMCVRSHVGMCWNGCVCGGWGMYAIISFYPLSVHHQPSNRRCLSLTHTIVACRG